MCVVLALHYGGSGTDKEQPMPEYEHVKTALPKLDYVDDPRGGAVACALLVVGAAVVAGLLLAVMLATGLA